MGINYQQDDDLEFLQHCSEEELIVLAQYLTLDKKGIEYLASQLLQDKQFKACAGKPDQYRCNWKLIAGELQHFGGDTFVNLIRGNGVLYKEILCDVCEKINVKFDRSLSAFEIENKMIAKLISGVWEEMTNEQKAELLKNSGVNEIDIVNGKSNGIAELAALQSAILLGGVASLGISALLAGTTAKYFAANLAGVLGGRVVASALGGPVGLAIGAVLLVPSISGVAYQVTIPSVIHIAYMRRAYANKDRF